jgi:pyruvate formate lyase activating enzyme
MRELAKVLDAVKIDLKAFTETYYRDIVAGELKPVLDTLILLKKLEIWSEIVYLVVPTLNDGDREFRELSQWMIGNLGPDVPIHFTRYYPQYKMQNIPPTPVKTLERAREIALSEGIRFVYVGNVSGHPGEHTYCPGCQKMLIKRQGFWIRENNIRNGKCPECDTHIPGVWI